MKKSLLLISLLISTPSWACAPQRTIKLPDTPQQYGDQYRAGLPLRDYEVVLTFDDGPHKVTTEALLNTLKRYCLKVTFFPVGEVALRNQDILRREVAEGHSIGSHSHDHPMPFNRLGDNRAKQEINQGISEIRSVIGDKMKKWFRFPGLGRSDRDEKLLTDMGFSVWGIDIEPRDWERPGNAVLMQRVISQLDKKKKGIIIFHDIHQPSVDFVPLLIETLIAKGYTFVHVE